MVREHYLRDDIWSGSPLDPESDPAANKLSADPREYLVVDTNVVLQQVLQGLCSAEFRERGAVCSCSSTFVHSHTVCVPLTCRLPWA